MLVGIILKYVFLFKFLSRQKPFIVVYKMLV